MTTRRHLGAVALGLAAPGGPRAARAQWPGDRPVEAIEPFPPGGGVDVMARLFLPFVARRHPGTRFVVTNRTGAAGRSASRRPSTPRRRPTLGAATLPNLNAIAMERAVRYRALDFVSSPTSWRIRAASTSRPPRRSARCGTSSRRRRRGPRA